MNFKKYFTIILTPAILFLACNSNNKSGSEENEEKANSNIVALTNASIKEIGLETGTVQAKPFTGFMNIPAKVLINQDYEAHVGSLLQGRVYKVFVKAGDYVKSGQELMQIEGLEIGEIKAGFLSAKANLEFQKANYERQKTLIEQNVGSQRSFLESRSEFEKALAEFNAQDKKIHSIGLDDEDLTNGKSTNDHTSGRLTVKAPISGMVVERNVVIGQWIDAATNAFEILNTSNVWVEGQIYEKDLNLINAKTKVIFTAPSYSGEKFNGTVTYISPLINEASRTITVRAEFDNTNGKLKPQMFGEMQIPVSNNSLAILIPAESVIKINNDDFVFVEKENNEGKVTFEKRQVKVMDAQDEFVYVNDGLKENEKVVTKGAFYLKSEMMKDELGED